MPSKTNLSSLRDFVRRECLFDPDAELNDETPLFPEIVDSLGVMEIVSFVEDHYAIEFSDDDLLAVNFASVGSIGALIQRRTDAA